MGKDEVHKILSEIVKGSIVPIEYFGKHKIVTGRKVYFGGFDKKTEEPILHFADSNDNPLMRLPHGYNDILTLGEHSCLFAGYQVSC